MIKHKKGCLASVLPSLAAPHGVEADQAKLRLCRGYSGSIVASSFSIKHYSFVSQSLGGVN